MSSGDLKHCFDFLDKGLKGYLSYKDFVLLMDENRRNINPYNEKATKYGNSMIPEDKVNDYLKQLEISDLSYIVTNRKSSKKLASPKIGGQKSPLG